jgi:PAS domain S-box-containing protein
MSDDEKKGTIQDEASWRRLEAALRASDARYQAIFHGTRDAIFIADAEGRLLDANRAALRMLGRTLEEVRTMRFQDLHPPEEAEAAAEAFATHLREPEKDLDRLHVLRSDGTRIPVEIGSALAEIDGRTINIGTFRDITRRRAVGESLRFQLSLQQAMTRIAASLVEATSQRFDGAIEDALGILGEIANASRVSLFQVIAAEDRLVLSHEWAATPDAGRRASLAAGVPLTLLPRLTRLIDEAEVLTIEDPRSLPADVDEALTRFARERRPSAAVPLAKGGRVFGALAVYGHVDEVRAWPRALVDALGLAGSILVNALERQRVEEERRRIELQLLNAQKLESLGVLAGGVAHDFNNLLVAILGNLELALAELAPGSLVREQIHDAELAAQRAAELTRQMLAYSGRGKLAVEPASLSQVVEEMLHILRISISKKAALRLSLPAELPAIEADLGQLRQVVMNLVLNASEAVGDVEGVIAVSVGQTECDRAVLGACWVDDGLEPGPYVYLEVTDTGCGIPREQKSRIFDPFFTTKFTGRGLGLPAVLGIVRGHRGAIAVTSTPGKGTTFRVYFPASRRPAAAAEATVGESWRGEGTVLLVDDEPMVRTVGKKMLERLGFDVLLADDGLQALALAEAHPELVLILLDLTMPRLDGAGTYRELARVAPATPVVVTSGYSEQDLEGRFEGERFAGFLQKPFRIAAVTARVRAALERSRSQPR